MSRRAVLGLLIAGCAFAQALPSFEVASVRPWSEKETGPVGTDGGPGTRDSGHYIGRGMPLRLYLCVAFDLPDCTEQISGPSWLESKYDIVANVPVGTTKEEFNRMLQNLLTERFQLALHHVMKMRPVYELVVAKGGSKLTQSVAKDEPLLAANGPRANVQHDADGFPVLNGRGIIASSGSDGLSHWTARQQPISRLAEALGNPGAAGRQVIDKTGLTGEYDFKLSYRMRLPGLPAADDSPELVLEDALEKQLGLKLVDARAPFDFVIIDRGEKVPLQN